MKLKFLIPVIALVLLINFAYGQNDFDTGLQKLSSKIADGIKKQGEKKIAVANFLDLQGNVTEFGRYVAESISVELVNDGLQVIDRSRLKDLLDELKLSEEKLLDPKNASKLGNLAGIDIIITGSITLLDNSVEISVKALDLNKGIIIAATRGAFARTEAINQLFRSQVAGGALSATPTATATAPTGLGSKTVNAFDDANRVKVTEMDKSGCLVGGAYYGYICFENYFPEDLILYNVSEVGETQILIPGNGKNCAPRLFISWDREGAINSKEIKCKFKTTGTDGVKYGIISILAESCKNKTIALHKRTMLLTNKEGY